MGFRRSQEPAVWPPLRQWAGRLWPYLIVSLVAAVAAAPLANTSLPCSDDAAFHLYRAVELGRLLELGYWLPRWAPDMALGYGYPFYNFYAPLSSYVVVALHGAAGLAYPAALKAAFALGLWLAGLSAFWLVQALWGPRAGVAAGITYTLAPYLAYDVLYRGNLAEAFAFVWPPLVLLGLDAALSPGPNGQPLSRARVRAALLAALAYAALILTHNIFALIASPLFAGFLLLRARQARSGRGLLLGALSLAFGIGLTTYFWLPAIVERTWVYSDRLLVPPIFTWYTNFVSAGELLALPRPEDPALINPSPARGVGAATALLCLPALLAGLGAARARNWPRASPIAYFALTLVGYALLTLSASAPVWRLVKPLELVQFPWRMLGPAAVCSAALVGAGVAALEAPFRRAGSARAWLSALPLAAVGAIVFFASVPAWYPRYCPAPITAGVAELIGYEVATNTIGTTAKGEYLPRTAPGVPADRAVAEALMAGQTPMRLALPAEAGTIISAAPRDPLDATYQVDVTRDAVAVYQQFYYPGWVIEVDGKPAAARPVPEGQAQAGLIEFDLPLGSRVVRARFGSTPLRAGASVISALAAAAWLAVGLWRRPRLARPRPASPTADSGRAVAGLVGVFAALVLAKFALIDRTPNPLRRPGLDQRALPLSGALGQHPLAVDFAGGIRLHGFDLSTTRLPADGAVEVAWYVSRWEASEARYWPAFRIEDSAGLAWHDPEYLPPRWHREPPPTGLWPLDQYAQWARRVALLPGTPPGTYTLMGEVFDLDTLRIASALDAAGSAAAPRLALGTLAVERPRQAWRLRPDGAGGRNLGAVTLLGASVIPAAASAGDTVLLTLDWRSVTKAASDDLAHITVTAAGEDEPALAFDLPPVSGYGLSQWQPGDEWRGQHWLRLPATLPGGTYSLALSLPGSAGAAQAAELRVTAPVRVFSAPDSAVQVGASFADVGVLAGYTVVDSPNTLIVTLVWQATATPAAAYHVFVHLSDDTGRVWAQSDGAPAGWSRPTTGWIAGEYILDEHRLALPGDLPAGAYTLRAGLYDPYSGQRVPAAGPGAEEGDQVELGRWRP